VRGNSCAISRDSALIFTHRLTTSAKLCLDASSQFVVEWSWFLLALAVSAFRSLEGRGWVSAEAASASDQETSDLPAERAVAFWAPPERASPPKRTSSLSPPQRSTKLEAG
jgi:hypothetical protein